MAQSIAEIQRRSDTKRGMKVKGLKMHEDVIALLERLAAQTGDSQAATVTKALELYAASLGIQCEQ
ncbi:hypothetical protein QB794_002260 [Salmonella enterica]|nr:hypothetical protein [Salmonella enterica subsp. enterica]EKS4789415.1 hypothetical protein [Salmonella enterica]EKS4862832.1 hypothetical protein [Salmonella enterica]EKS4880545.1 hypothetical protein [Salmonella enterica]EKS4885004.1 hypothetical protein [Salmonella enterica]